MVRFTLLCSILAAAGCTETTAACPDESHVRYADGRCGPPPSDDGGGAGTDAGSATDDAGGGDDCGGCAADELCRADGQCVECIGTMDCTGGEVCAISPGECVECVDNTTCPADRPTCDMNACTATCDRMLCSGRFSATPACDPDTGSCVPCDRANEAADCSGNSCDPDTLSCTAVALGSLDLCEPCISDSECGTFDDPRTGGIETITLRCVPTDWRPDAVAAPMPAGSYCLPDSGDPMLADCPAGVPRRERLLSAAITPMEATYCLPLAVTTCAALLDDDVCPGVGFDDECGLMGEPDGLCASGQCRAVCDPAESLSCLDGETCRPLDTRHYCSP